MLTVITAIFYGLLIAVVTVLILYLFCWLSLIVHEGGHYLAARWVDVRVDLVRLGSGRLLWSFERGGARWEIHLFPFHGMVHVEEGIFAYSIRQLSTVVLGGPIATLVLAGFLTWFYCGHFLEMPTHSGGNRDFMNQLSEFSIMIWAAIAASPMALMASAWATLIGCLIPARMAIGSENVPTDGLQLSWLWFPEWKRQSPNERRPSDNRGSGRPPKGRTSRSPDRPK
jgi:hypothetical protein